MFINIFFFQQTLKNSSYFYLFMKKRIVVLSLGGSLIVPDKIDVKFLNSFKKTLLKNTSKCKFVVVCGGGKTARTYIKGLREIKANEKLQSLAGISVTRMNARFMNFFFNIDESAGIPHTANELKNQLKRKNIVFCGGLEYKPHQTSDATAAQIAKLFKTEFINLTNVSGLHDKNPLKFKNAKFIPRITWKKFYKMANKEKFSPGQHFVLDQTAAKIILEDKIPAYILGKNMENLDKLINGKDFYGSIIMD